jgi:hypothetical protein
MTLFQNLIGGIEEVAVKVTGNTATTIVDGTSPDTQAWLVPWLQVNENAGGTQTLTVDLYDGTNSYCLGAASLTWKAKAVTAYLSLGFTDIEVPSGWKLRVTSSDAAGKFDVLGVKARRVS